MNRIYSALSLSSSFFYPRHSVTSSSFHQMARHSVYDDLKIDCKFILLNCVFDGKNFARPKDIAKTLGSQYFDYPAPAVGTNKPPALIPSSVWSVSPEPPHGFSGNISP